MCLPMLVQGLEGAPRRFAVLPSEFDTLTQLTVPFVVITALGQVVFGWNLVHDRAREEARAARVGARVLRPDGVAAGGRADHRRLGARGQRSGAGETPKQPALGGTPAVAAAGAEAFTQNCGSCHTLKAAGTQGTVGPNLDDMKPSSALVLSAIQKGGQGSGTMPKDLLTGKDAQEVSDYVAEVAGE